MQNTALDALHDLHDKAATIEALGGKVTPAFTRTRTRWTELRNTTADPLDGVAEALTGTDAPDLASLAERVNMARVRHAAAGNSQAAAAAWQDLAARLLPAQRAEWAKTTGANYTRAAKAYTEAAAALVATLEQVDPDAAPEALMDAAPEVRTAWVEVPNLAARLDKAADFLTTAASQAGVRTKDDGALLGLLATIPSSANRRTVWEKLDGDHGRAGRWGTLHALGATLAPPATPKEATAYRRAKPLETRYLRTDTGLRPVDYDPETKTPAGALPAGGSIGNTGASWSL